MASDRDFVFMEDAKSATEPFETPTAPRVWLRVVSSLPLDPSGDRIK